MEDDEDRGLPESEPFVLLADRRRRLVVRILEDVSTPLSACKLAELVGKCEHEELPTDRLRVIYLSLYHNHLPKLEAAGVVAYDPEVGTVAPGPNFGVLVGALTKLSEDADSFSDR